MRAMIRTTILVAGLTPWLSVLAAESERLDFGAHIGEIFGDGSGYIGSPEDVERISDTWSFRIKADAITDETIITANRRAYRRLEGFGKIQLETDLYLLFEFSDPNQELICIAGHDFPGLTGMIRIDDNEPIETNEEGCVLLDDKLETQLKAGNALVLRGSHWPYRDPETQTISLDGYTSLSNFLREKRPK